MFNKLFPSNSDFIDMFWNLADWKIPVFAYFLWGVFILFMLFVAPKIISMFYTSIVKMGTFGKFVIGYAALAVGIDARLEVAFKAFNSTVTKVVPEAASPTNPTAPVVVPSVGLGTRFGANLDGVFSFIKAFITKATPVVDSANKKAATIFGEVVKTVTSPTSPTTATVTTPNGVPITTVAVHVEPVANVEVTHTV